MIAVLTADGFIAKDPKHSAAWASKGDRGFFVELTKRAGVVIMGKNTYETMQKPLPDRLNIVYSKDTTYEGVEITTKEPAELLDDLEKRGYTEAAIIGGQQIFTMFMEQKLIDTAYFTMEPVFFGQGITLFGKPMDVELEFKTMKIKYLKKHATNTFLFEYNVVK